MKKLNYLLSLALLAILMMLSSCRVVAVHQIKVPFCDTITDVIKFETIKTK